MQICLHLWLNLWLELRQIEALLLVLDCGRQIEHCIFDLLECDRKIMQLHIRHSDQRRLFFFFRLDHLLVWRDGFLGRSRVRMVGI